MENVFDVLCSALTLAENKARFHDEEGVELMCLLLKAKGVAQLRSIKILNHACSGPHGSTNCVRLIESQGLKPLFSIFVGKAKTEASKQDEEHMLELLMSLFNNLKSDSMERIRLVVKFVEKEYEKVDRLVEMRRTVQGRLQPLDASTSPRNGDDDETQLAAYLERIDHGLFSLQLIDYILAWLIMEDDGIVHHVKMLFRRTSDSLDSIVDTLKEYYSNVGDDALVTLPDGDDDDDDDGLRLKDVIVNLVNYILSVM